MEKDHAKGNGSCRPLESAEACAKLAEILNFASAKLTPYCWQLAGKEPDSLCNLLDLDEPTTKAILWHCRIFYPESTRVNTKNFESFAAQLTKPNIDWSMYRPSGMTKQVPFIKIGSMSNVVDDDEALSLKGSDQYGKGGELSNKRKQDATDRMLADKESKRVKREAFIET